MVFDVGIVKSKSVCHDTLGIDMHSVCSGHYLMEHPVVGIDSVMFDIMEF